VTEWRKRLDDRREVLRRELELGEGRLRDLERESLTLQRTVLQISGAIQVLDELLQQEEPEPSPTPPGQTVTVG
jgi:hypothetical protein